MGFIISSRIDRQTSIDGLIEAGTERGQRIDPPPGVSIGLDGFSSLSRARDDTGWRVVFEGYLATDPALSRRLGLPLTAAKEQPADLVAQLIQQEGADGLARLSGCYALVAVDPSSGRMLATRDRCGGRTLSFHLDQGQITMATRSAWVMQAAPLPFRDNPAYLAAHFGLDAAPPSGSTAFEGVRELMPGERLGFENGQLELTPRSQALDARAALYSDPVESFRALLTDAVRTVLPPTGDATVMLSGGLDSGPAALLADDLLARSDQRLWPISWSLSAFPEADESEWIRAYEGTLRHDPELTDLSAALPFSDLHSPPQTASGPSFNAFQPLIDHCYRRAAESGCRVLLNAAVGDRIYPPPQLLLIDLLRHRRAGVAFRELRRLWRTGGLAGLLRDPGVRRIFRELLPAQGQGPARRAWLQPDAEALRLDTLQSPPLVQGHPFPAYAAQLFGPAMAFGQAQANERAQRFGVDRRDPYQNEALLEFMLYLPVHASWQNGWDKAILREALKHRLPEPIRQKKRTGLLHSVYRAGLTTHADRIRAALFDADRPWQAYVHSESIERALAGESDVPEMLIAQCIGYVQWRNHWRVGVP